MADRSGWALAQDSGSDFDDGDLVEFDVVVVLGDDRYSETIAVAAIQESLTGIRWPAARRRTRSRAQASATVFCSDRQGLDVVAEDLRVVSDKGEAVGAGLGDQHAIEGIGVVVG